MENVGKSGLSGVSNPETHLLDFEILHFSHHTLDEADVFSRNNLKLLKKKENLMSSR